MELRLIGHVESPLIDRDAAPKQGDEGSPEAWLVFYPDVADGIRDLHAGTEIILLTWLDRARRDVLTVHPRGDPNNPMRGVFSTRSPDRPNPNRAAPRRDRRHRRLTGSGAKSRSAGWNAYFGRKARARANRRTVADRR